MKSIKKIITAILLTAVIFSLASCTAAEKSLTCTLDELKSALSSLTADGELFPYDEERLADDVAIMSGDYTEGFFCIPLNSAGVETVAFFVCADDAAVDKIKTRLNTYVNDTRNYQKDYNADNYQVALDAEVITEGKYVYLVMSPKKAELKKAISDRLK